MASKISTAARAHTPAERKLRDAAFVVYQEQTAKGKTPDQAWDRVTDFIDCNLVGRVLTDEGALSGCT